LPHHTSLSICCYILESSVTSFDRPWLLPSHSPSDAPGKHGRAFVTKVRVADPLYSIYAFFWYSKHDSTTEFCMLPRFSSAAHQLSPPAVIVHLHSAVCFAYQAICSFAIPSCDTPFLELFLYFMINFCLLAFSFWSVNSNAGAVAAARPFFSCRITSSKQSFPR
jgi:hypothetical protein